MIAFNEMKNRTILGICGLLFIFLSVFVRPVLSAHHNDAFLYLTAAECYAREGWNCLHDREPFFPLFLSLFLRFNISIQHLLPLAQSSLFLGSVYFLLSAFPSRKIRTQNLLTALLIALVPTFLITMNGAAYTEAISASMVCLLVGFSLRFLQAEGRSKTCIFGVSVFFLAMFLDLTKGSFVYIHFSFAFLILIFIIWKTSPRIRLAFLSLLLICSGLAANAGWRYHLGQDRIFSRGGAVLYGRAEYARRFDFRTQSLRYLVNALSESACARIYADGCSSVAFGAENTLGNSRAANGTSDEVLLRDGIRILLENPVRQSAFALFEWTKFVLHHGTAGFARLELPLFGSLMHSTFVTILLKLANIILLLIFLRELAHVPGRLTILNERSLPLLLCLSYIFSYLLVYGFVTTVIRMAYPVAPLLLIFIWLSFSDHPLRWRQTEGLK